MRFLSFLLFFLPLGGLFAQETKALYIRPMAMGGGTISHITTQSANHASAGIGIQGSIGGFIDWRTSSRLALSVGLHPHAIGAAVNISAPKELLRFSNSLVSQRNSSVYGLSLPIALNYQLGKVQLLGNAEKDNYFLRFKLLGIAGISLSKYQPSNRIAFGDGATYNLKDGSNTGGGSLNKDEDDYIAHTSQTQILKHRNISLEAGIGFQFFNKLGNDGPRLDLIYSQGLIAQQSTSIQYEINQQYNGAVSVQTNASWMALRVSFPIRLKRWD